MDTTSRNGIIFLSFMVAILLAVLIFVLKEIQKGIEPLSKFFNRF